MEFEQVAQNSTLSAIGGTGMVAANALALAMVVGLVAPRAFAFTVFIAAGAVLAAGFVERRRLTPPDRDWRPPTMAVAAFVALVALSAAWSIAPAMALQHAIFLSAAAGLSIAAALLVASDAAPLSQRAVYLLLSTMLVLCAAAVIDVTSGMEVRRWIVNLLGLKVPFLSPNLYRMDGNVVGWVDPAIVNRGLVSLAILLWPALLLARSTRRPLLVATGLYFLVVIAVFASGSETAKLQMVASTIIFLLTLASRSLSTHAVMAGWVVACVFVVPLMSAMYDRGWHKPGMADRAEEYVSASPGARITIAHEYTKRIPDALILGHGAGSSRAIADNLKKNEPAAPPMAQHPHNCYLQIWFEFGAVGVALFFAAGLLLVRALAATRAPAYGLAQFASTAALLAPSYGLWQPWQSGMICVSIVFMAVALRSVGAADRDEPTETS